MINENDVVYDDEGKIKYLYELKPAGRALVERELDRDGIGNVVETIRRIKRRYHDELSLPEVIDEVYTEYPEYAEDSVY